MFKMGRTMARKILAPGGSSSNAAGPNNQDQLGANSNSNMNTGSGSNNNEPTKVKTGDDINDFSKLEQDPRLPLNVRQVFKITKSWKAIARTMSKTGTAMFLKFQHLKGSELHESMELREHAATVMSTLDQSINLLSDYDNFVAYLHSIGEMHRKVPGFKREHFWKIEQPFLKAVKHTLDERCNETIEEIYKIAIKLIIETIAEGYGDHDDHNGRPKDAPKDDKTGSGDPSSSGTNNNNNPNGDSTKTKPTTFSKPAGAGGGGAGDVGRQRTSNWASESTTTTTTGSNNNNNNADLSPENRPKEGLVCEELIEATSNLIERIRTNYHDSDTKSLREALFELSSNCERNERPRKNNNNNGRVNNNNNNDSIARSETTLITSCHNDHHDQPASKELQATGSQIKSLRGRDSGADEGQPVTGEPTGWPLQVPGEEARQPTGLVGPLKAPAGGADANSTNSIEQTTRRSSFWRNNSSGEVVNVDGSSLATTSEQIVVGDTSTPSSLRSNHHHLHPHHHHPSTSPPSLLCRSSVATKSSHIDAWGDADLAANEEAGSSPINGVGGTVREPNQDNPATRPRVDCSGHPRDASDKLPGAIRQPGPQVQLALLSREMSYTAGATKLVASNSRRFEHSAKKTTRGKCQQQQSYMKCTKKSISIKRGAIHESGHFEESSGHNSQERRRDDSKADSTTATTTTKITETTTTNENHQREKQIQANNQLWRGENRDSGESISQPVGCPMSHQIRTNNKAGKQIEIESRLTANEHNRSMASGGHSNIDEQSNNPNQTSKVIGKSKQIATKTLIKGPTIGETKPNEQAEIIRMLILVHKLLLVLSSSKHKTTIPMTSQFRKSTEVH